MRVFYALIICLCSQLCFSQKFMHGAGTTASVLYGFNKTNANADSWITQTTVTYFPRYNFIENQNSSVSIGAPVGAGFGFISDVYSDNWALSFAYDLSAVLDYNIGCKSTRANPKSFGGYFGGGFSYFHVGISNSVYADFRGATYGPLVRGGLRFLFSKTRMAGHSLNTGLFYKKGLEDSKLSTIGLNLLWE